MSDQRLRALERRWRETGSIADEADYLLERVRVGELEQEWLELAASCGHAAAVRATNRRETPEPGPQVLEALLDRAAARSPALLGRLGYALLAPLRPSWNADEASADLTLEALDRWVAVGRTDQGEEAQFEALAADAADVADRLSDHEAPTPGLSLPGAESQVQLPWRAGFAMTVCWLSRLAADAGATASRRSFIARKAIETAMAAREAASGNKLTLAKALSELGTACLGHLARQ